MATTNLDESALDFNVDVEMFGYPTVHPSWVAIFKDISTSRKIVEACFQLPYDIPTSGGISEYLARTDLWEHCNVAFHHATEFEMAFVLHFANKTLQADVYTLLLECEQFYPDLECRDAAVALAENKCYFEALVMIAKEVPPNTAWRLDKNIGYNDSSGFAWHAATISQVWGMKVGYPIMLEAIKRKVASNPTVELR